MCVKIRVPFFEMGVKNYVYGDRVLELAKAADAAALKYDIDVMFIAPYADIWRVAKNTNRLIILAPYMDVLRPGRGMADVLPESIRAAGAQGVVINHCERPMTLTAIRHTIARAKELRLLSFACAGSLEEARAVAELHPDLINPEPPELIGTGNTASMDFVRDSTRAVKEINSGILVEQAAGVTTGVQVYCNIMAGADGVGVASGILNAADPEGMIDEMVCHVRKACEDMKKTGGPYENLPRIH